VTWLLRAAVDLELEMNINRDVKQLIVMRTDLNMRKGKMIAQGAHASIMWTLDFIYIY
jgi:peptidyl-tRNA hydrolase